jgi:hypothetical protein
VGEDARALLDRGIRRDGAGCNRRLPEGLNAEVVTPSSTGPVSRDVDDDTFLAAVAAQADYLVSEDKDRLRTLNTYRVACWRRDGWSQGRPLLRNPAKVCGDPSHHGAERLPRTTYERARMERARAATGQD